MSPTLAKVWAYEESVAKWDGSEIRKSYQLSLSNPDSIFMMMSEISVGKRYGTLGKLIWVRKSRFKIHTLFRLVFVENSEDYVLEKIEDGGYYLYFRYKILEDGSLVVKIRDSLSKRKMQLEEHYFLQE